MALKEDEVVKRLGCADRLEAYFRAQPHVWIDGLELAKIGGAYAWRTRLSELRRERGMAIENEQRTYGSITRSLYKYVPAAPIADEAPHDTNTWSLR